MRPLEQHEKFEMEVLGILQRTKVLDQVIFHGGTMMRLCYKLDRYSVDLDFYLKPNTKDFKKTFDKMINSFRDSGFEITDSQAKHATYLVELRSGTSPRRLKIEIRKKPPIPQETELNIAFSEHVPDIQVRVTTATLSQMWRNKIEAFTNRGEIRDAYDLEFLIRRGAGKIKDIERKQQKKIREIIKSFTIKDFRTTLGTILPTESRQIYNQGKFPLLEAELDALPS